MIEPALPGLRSHHFDTAIGSSGTIINLAEIAIKTGNGGSGNDNGLSRAELSRVAALLCSLPSLSGEKSRGSTRNGGTSSSAVLPSSKP